MAQLTDDCFAFSGPLLPVDEVGRLIREQLETAKSKGGKQRFLRHAGAIAGGPPDVSSRKGFSRS